jgi:hypothetical protein
LSKQTIHRRFMREFSGTLPPRRRFTIGEALLLKL